MEVLKSKEIIQGDATQHYQQHFNKIITAALAFRLDDPNVLLSENDFVKIWQEVSAGQPLDDHYPKVLSEVLVLGSFIAPEVMLKDHAYAQVKIATINKTLRVFPERYWYPAPKLNEFLPYTPNYVYKDVALDWRNAYGGAPYSLNPEGQGAVAHKSALYDEAARITLPLVEAPECLLRQPFPRHDEIRPASFAPLCLQHPLRWQYMGPSWSEAYPSLPAALNPLFFQQALPDQCQKNCFIPGEPFELIGMSKSAEGLGVIKEKLPLINLRMFVRTATGRFEELLTRFDTLWFLPNHNIGVMIVRAKMKVEGWNANFIDTLMIVRESADEIMPLRHYHEVLHRLTGEARHLYQSSEYGLRPKTDADMININKLKALRTRAAQLAKPRIISKGLPKITYKKLTPARLQLIERMQLIAREDFSGYDLSGIDFSQKVLEQVNFINANLTGALFDNAALQEVDFSRAKLDGACFRQARLHHCKFYKTACVKTNFQFADIYDGHFVHTTLTEVNLNHAKFQDCLFIKALWRNFRVDNLWLSNAIFNNSRWQDVKLTYVKLSHLQFSEHHFLKTEFIDADAEQINFVGAQSLWDSCLVEASAWRATHFMNGVISHTQFNKSNFIKSEWRASKIRHTQFNDIDLSEANFMDAELEHCWFENANLSKAGWQGAYLNEIDFVNTALPKAELNRAQLGRIHFTASAKDKVA